MKITPIHILTLALSLLCLSCSEDSSAPSLQEYPVDVEFDIDMTKVGISGNDLFWQSGDQVAFRATGASGASAVTVLTLNDVDSGLAKAKFKGTVAMSEAPVKCEFAFSGTFDDEGKAVFDYSQQDGTHKPYLYGAADYSAEGMNCVLGHVGGLIRLTVAEGVESVSLSSNSGSYTAPLSDGISEYVGQKISKVIFSEAGGVTASEDASHLIDVAVPSGAGVVYMFMPAMEFVDGFSIVCTKGNEKMFRSFSKTGGNSSSYSFLSGKVLDIDLSEFVGFTADCTCTWNHVYDDSQILQGTNVFLTDFTFIGAPEKIVDQCGVGIYDESGNFIRWWEEKDGVFDGNSHLMSNYTGEWPLLLPGVYTLYTSCNINGHTLKFPATQKMTVTAPTFTITVSGKTSWDYRTSPSAANAMDNDAIVEIGAKVSIASTILASEKYDFKVQFSTNTGKTSEKYDMNDSDYASSCIFDGLAWGAHDLEAAVTFCGVTQKSAYPLTCYITGLPYEADWTKQNYDDTWIYSDHIKYDNDEYKSLTFSGPAGSIKKQYIISPEFKLPSNVNTSTSLQASSCNIDFIAMDYKKCRYFYYKAGPRSVSSADCSGSYISATYFSDPTDLSSDIGLYVEGDKVVELSPSNPCMVYSTQSYTHDKHLFGIKIKYAQ